MEHERSIDANLMNMPDEVQERYQKNKKKWHEDYLLMELWALNGFMTLNEEES